VRTAERYAPTVDEATAIGRALRDLFSGALRWEGQRVDAVFSEWQEPPQEQVLPAIAVAPVSGEYSGSKPVPAECEESWDGEHVLMCDGEFTGVLSVAIWCTTPEMRGVLVRQVREVLQDRDTQERNVYGRTISVPDYFGGAAPAVVEPRAVAYEDTGDETFKRHRIATMQVSAQLPMLRLEAVGPLEVRVRQEDM
jgi:hypothetical protein